MLKPAGKRIIRRALISRGDVPFPEERNDLTVVNLGITWMGDDSGIGSLLDRSLGNPLSPIFGVPLALPSAVCATSAEWELEITLTDELGVQQVLFLREIKLDWEQIAYAHFPSLASSATFGSTGLPTHF